MDTTALISLHGGHSGQFCSHAKDSLEDIIKQYIKLGFQTVGITEHAPPVNDQFLYPDEKKLGFTAKGLYKRFEDYFQTIRSLKSKYANKIKIHAGMETETCGDYVSHTQKLIARFQPDYIVGSIHHMNNLCFDYSKEEYKELVLIYGSISAMYAAYFDLQYEMIKQIKPFVVGHFDLIRIYDDEYEKRVLEPQISKKITRNLGLIKSMNLVMDYNLRPLAKGKKEPYITASILQEARKIGIMVAPGDDSHSVDQAGQHVTQAIQTLEMLGFETQWPTPVLISGK